MNSNMSFMIGYFGATKTDQKALAVYRRVIKFMSESAQCEEICSCVHPYQCSSLSCIHIKVSRLTNRPRGAVTYGGFARAKQNAYNSVNPLVLSTAY